MFLLVSLAHMIKKPQPSTSSDRRGFMRGMLTMIAGGFALLGPLWGGLALLLDPLRRNRNESSGAFIMVARLASLPANGIPMKFDILSNRKDAWNHYSNVPNMTACVLQPTCDKGKRVNLTLNDFILATKIDVID